MNTNRHESEGQGIRHGGGENGFTGHGVLRATEIPHHNPFRFVFIRVYSWLNYRVRSAPESIVGICVSF
jgi:hypothetical protein